MTPSPLAEPPPEPPPAPTPNPAPVAGVADTAVVQEPAGDRPGAVIN